MMDQHIAMGEQWFDKRTMEAYEGMVQAALGAGHCLAGRYPADPHVCTHTYPIHTPILHFIEGNAVNTAPHIKCGTVTLNQCHG